MIAVPIGILTAVYLVEYGQGKRLARAISFFVDLMMGVPSIVAGLFIYAFWLLALGFQFSGFAGALALVILMLPVVVRNSEEMLKLVPSELREASYALGVPKWRTITKVVLPTAFSGIVTGIVLGIARAMGETAPLLLLVGTNPKINFDPFSLSLTDPNPNPMTTLPTYIFEQLTTAAGSTTAPAFYRAWAAALVLTDHHHHVVERAGAVRRPVHQGPRLATRRTRIAMAKSIDVSDLNVYYGKFLAVEGVSMTVEPRSVTAFIGPSGCGKSTFLRTLNRMHEVIPGARVEGKVLLDGEDIYHSSVDPVNVRRTIGMVFQRPNPFPTMSIYDNVVAGLKLQGRQPKKKLDEIVEKALKGANLWNEVSDRLSKPGAGLSGGQQQRLCIARAIAVEPQVLLMDEPCSALDPISTLAIEDLISELKERYTIVIVTHNMQQAARVSDRTAFFNLAAVGKPGKLIEMADTQKIFTNPSQKGTEDYITGRFG